MKYKITFILLLLQINLSIKQNNKILFIVLVMVKRIFDCSNRLKKESVIFEYLNLLVKVNEKAFLENY